MMKPVSERAATTWKPTKADLFISAGMALGFPLLAGALWNATGALVPMVLYYGAAWGIARWRRGGSGYRWASLPKPPVSFYIHLAVIAGALALAYVARIRVEETVLGGVVFTALVWAVANASSEQILWLYIFDSWDLFAISRFAGDRSDKARRVAFRVIGLILFTAFVGLIHTMYWARFLHTVDPALTVGTLFVIATSLSGYLHIIVWRQSGRMIYTFIPHFLLNLFPLFWTGYSILPYLWRLPR